MISVWVWGDSKGTLSPSFSLSVCLSVREPPLGSLWGKTLRTNSTTHIPPATQCTQTFTVKKRHKLHYYSARITTRYTARRQWAAHTHTQTQSAAQTQRGHTGTQKFSGWWAKCWSQAAVMNLRFWEWTLEGWNWAGRCVPCLRRRWLRRRRRGGSCTCKDVHNKRHKQQVFSHHLLSTCVFWLTSKSWLFTTAAWEDEDDVNGGNIREKTLCSQRSIKCTLAWLIIFVLWLSVVVSGAA